MVSGSGPADEVAAVYLQRLAAVLPRHRAGRHAGDRGRGGRRRHGEGEGAGVLPTGVRDHYRPRSGVAAVIEGRVLDLAGIDEGRGIVGIGLVGDRVVVGDRGSADEVGPVDGQRLVVVRWGYRSRLNSSD